MRLSYFRYALKTAADPWKLFAEANQELQLHKFASASVGCTSTFARFMPPPILPSKNFLEIVDELNVNIEFVSAREAIDTSGPMGRMFLTMVGSIAELKRSLIVERIEDGMRRAKWGAAVRACTARR
jgi:hypothetical protein